MTAPWRGCRISLRFAQRHGLKIGAIDDLIAYRLRNDHLVKRVAETHVDERLRRRLRPPCL